MRLAKRNYNISDANLIQYAKIVHQKAIQDKNLFATYDTTFTDSRLTQLQTQIQAAEAELPNYVFASQQRTLTEDLNDMMAEARRHYRFLKAFLSQVVFVEMPHKLAAFGLKQFRKVRQSYKDMIVFLKALNAANQQYSEVLLQKGLPQHFLDATQNIYEKLETALVAQRLFKREKAFQTTQRIGIFNELYRQVKIIRDLAKIVYDDDASRLFLYLLPQKRAKQQAIIEVEVMEVLPKTELIVLDKKMLENSDETAEIVLENRGETDIFLQVSNEKQAIETEKIAVAVENLAEKTAILETATKDFEQETAVLETENENLAEETIVLETATKDFEQEIEKNVETHSNVSEKNSNETQAVVVLSPQEKYVVKQDFFTNYKGFNTLSVVNQTVAAAFLAISIYD